MNSLDKIINSFNKFSFDISGLNLSFFFRAQMFLLPVMILFYKENGLSENNYYSFLGIFYCVSILMELPIGYISDFFSRRNMIIVSYFLFLLRITLWYFYGGYWCILAGEIIFAVSKVMFDSNTSSYLYELLKSNEKESLMSKYYGYLNFYLSLGTSTASLAGAFLYIRLGSKSVLLMEFIVVSLAVLLMLLLPNIKSSINVSYTLRENFYRFFRILRFVFRNKNIKYHVLYSGLLISISILFSSSFQVLMEYSLFPVFLFGVVLFINHLTRALFSFSTFKVLEKVNLKRLSIYTFILYCLAFLAIFVVLNFKNVVLDFCMLAFICIVIGFQLVFTITHISRLQCMMFSNIRSFVVSSNSVISRVLTAIVLLTTGGLVSRIKLTGCFTLYMLLFVLFGIYFVYKINKSKVKN